MDDVRAEFWEALRHLFPDDAMAVPLEQGDLLISWKTHDDPYKPNKRSAPIYLRFEPALIAKMQQVNRRERERMARAEVETVKAGLSGYRPEDPLQKARFIVLG